MDLFSGTRSWTKYYNATKDNIISVDINYRQNPSLCRDIITWDFKNELPFNIDVIYSSPPCNLYFTQIKQAKGCCKYTDQDKQKSLLFVERTIEIIKYYNPKYWIIENPLGKMRTHYPNIFNIPFRTLSYCMYGFKYRKDTDIWTNLPLSFLRCTHETHDAMLMEAKHIDRIRIPLKLTQEITNFILEKEGVQVG